MWVCRITTHDKIVIKFEVRADTLEAVKQIVKEHLQSDLNTIEEHYYQEGKI